MFAMCFYTKRDLHNTFCHIKNIIHYHYLQSSLITVTVASPGLPIVTLLGSEYELIVSMKFSLYSNVLSSIIAILNVANVTPAGNVTVYGPEV